MVRKFIKKAVMCTECGNQKENAVYGDYCDNCDTLLRENSINIHLFHKKYGNAQHKKFCCVDCMKKYMKEKKRVFVTCDLWCTNYDLYDLLRLHDD